MKRNGLGVSMLFLLIVGLGSVPGLAQGPGKFCETWKGEEVRCGFGREFINYTAVITVKNQTSGNVSFDTGEWHSACGWPGSNVKNQSRILKPSETVTFQLQKPSGSTTCREFFIHHCTADQGRGKCKDLLAISGDAN